MKKIALSLIILILTLAVSTGAFAQGNAVVADLSVRIKDQDVIGADIITISDNTADGNLSVKVNGEYICFKTEPFIDENGRTQMPVREFCNHLGKKVTWTDETQTVTISSVSDEENASEDSCCFTIGEKSYRINETICEMDTAAQIIDDKTFVPLRYLAEMMGYIVLYNPVYVTYPERDDFVMTDVSKNVSCEPFVELADGEVVIGFTVTNKNELPFVLKSATSCYIDCELYNAAGEEIESEYGYLQMFSELSIENEEKISENYDISKLPDGLYSAEIKLVDRGFVGEEEITLTKKKIIIQID